MDVQNLKKEYTNGEITVVWESGKCTHSANCNACLKKIKNPFDV